jgi:hypothetical protein
MVNELDFEPLPAPVTREAMDKIQLEAGLSGRLTLTPICHPFANFRMNYFDGTIESYCSDCGQLASVFDLRTIFDAKGKQ